MTRRQGTTLLVFLWLKVSSSFVDRRLTTPHNGWAISRHHQCNGYCSRLYLSTDVIEEKKSATLNFRGEFTLNSEPGKIVESDKLVAFFLTPEHRNLLITTGEQSRPVTEVDASEDLLAEWKAAAERVEAAAPQGYDDEVGEALVWVQTGGVNFPGLQVTSKALLGSKTSIINSTPMFEFVLIKDEQSLDGLPPVVWIYKQLTGYGNKASESKTSARSRTRVTVEIDERESELRFKSASYLEVDVNLPSFFLRLLPVSKEKAEEQGSAAILKTVKADVHKGMAKFKAAYDAWVPTLIKG